VVPAVLVDTITDQYNTGIYLFALSCPAEVKKKKEIKIMELPA
jgi:hypothetical protein